jgi:hypothetical protein
MLPRGVHDVTSALTSKIPPPPVYNDKNRLPPSVSHVITVPNHCASLILDGVVFNNELLLRIAAFDVGYVSYETLNAPLVTLAGTVMVGATFAPPI